MKNTHGSASEGVQQDTGTSNLSKWFVRMFGIILILASLSIYMQFVPMLFIFTGAYIGIPKDTVIGNMDSVVWILTSITFMILSLYVYIAWLLYAWRRFIVQASSLKLPMLRKSGPKDVS